MGAVVVLEAHALDPEAWAPFGWVPRPDDDPADGRDTLEFAWHDPHLNVIRHSPDEVERTEDGFLIDRLYRHDSHTQALVPLNCDSVIAVAPAAADLAAPAGLHALRAFRLRPLDRLVLHRGTWHWGPFPLGDAPLELLNVQGRRYAEDNASVDLRTHAGVTIVVDVTP